MANFQWNEAGLARLLGPAGPIAQLVEEKTDATKRACQQLCPKRSGDTSRSFRSEVSVVSGGIRGRVWSDDPVVRYLEDGTGLYGPRRQRIYPRRARVLRWEEGGRVHYAPSIRGMRAQPFMERSLRIGVAPWPVQTGR